MGNNKTRRQKINNFPKYIIDAPWNYKCPEPFAQAVNNPSPTILFSFAFAYTIGDHPSMTYPQLQQKIWDHKNLHNQAKHV